MTIDEFWSLIERCQSLASNDEMLVEILTKELSKFSVEEIISFEDIQIALSHKAYDNKLWVAAYVINGGCSDDHFADFRQWLIARGRQVYEKALNDPDSLVNVPIKMGEFGGEADLFAMGSVAWDAYKLKTGKRDFREIRDKISPVPPYPKLKNDDVIWDEQDDDSMMRLVPKLFQKF